MSLCVGLLGSPSGLSLVLYQKRVRVFDRLVATFVWPHVFWVSGEHVVACLDLLWSL